MPVPATLSAEAGVAVACDTSSNVDRRGVRVGDLSKLLGDGSGTRASAQLTDPESKLRNNLLLLVCYMYLFQVGIVVC